MIMSEKVEGRAGGWARLGGRKSKETARWPAGITCGACGVTPLPSVTASWAVGALTGCIEAATPRECGDAVLHILG